MRVKEQSLDRISLINIQLNAKMEQISQLNERRSKAIEIPMDKNRLMKIEKEISKLAEEYAVEVLNLLKVESELTNKISKIKKPLSRTILQLRFINNLTWQEIADKVNYSLVHVKRLGRKAVGEVTKYD